MNPITPAEGIALMKKFSIIIILGALVIGGLGADMVKNMADSSYMTSSDAYAVTLPRPAPAKDKHVLPFCVDGAVGRWLGCSL